MLIIFALLVAFSSAVMMTSSPSLPRSSASPSRVSKYPNLLALKNQSNSNNSPFPSNLSLGELMIKACSSEAENTFEQRKAPPGVIACCQALTLVDCMVQQCQSLSSDDGDLHNISSTADHHHHNPIAECSQLRLAALHVSMDALCEMVNVRNLSLPVCSSLPMTANLGLVAALMIAAFLLITTLCGLYMWAQNKLRSRRKGQGQETRVKSTTAVAGSTPSAPGQEQKCCKRRSSVKSRKTVKSVKGLKKGSKLESPMKRSSLSKMKLAAKSSVVKKVKKQ
ncbi:hypothetical protein TYRP_003354 [Tyrophagus putrescentiae]|nr:hypothetical protein TYRP_003354 [Tyrophagus putrescentiae]